MLGLGTWTVVGMTIDIWSRSEHQFRPSRRWPAGFILGTVALNLVAWVANLAPALLAPHPRSMLAGTGLTTNPVYVQDLALWLPAFLWVGVGTWKGHGPRTALSAVVLSYWALESVSVAVDQWWGHHADPASAVVSPNLVPLFLIVGALTVWPLVGPARRGIHTRRRGPGRASVRGLPALGVLVSGARTDWSDPDGPGSSRSMTVVDLKQ